MVKFGIISDTHLSVNDDVNLSKNLVSQLKEIFLDVDEIIHAGDINESFVLDLLKEIAPVRSVKGESDKITGLEEFIKISANKYNIGVIHKKPEDLEAFLARQTKMMDVMANRYPQAIQDIEPEYGFHFERDDNKKVAETDRFILYQILPFCKHTCFYQVE